MTVTLKMASSTVASAASTISVASSARFRQSSLISSVDLRRCLLALRPRIDSDGRRPPRIRTTFPKMRSASTDARKSVEVRPPPR